jgi:hypothetical protein
MEYIEKHMPKNVQIKQMLLILIDKYYEFEGAGGTLHVHLDDHNYGKADIKYCLKHEDYFGATIAKLWNQLTEEEQYELREESWKSYEEIEKYNTLIKQ